ncbi:hypothetical protein F2981_20180 (plasmid) [Sinorhizobium meliloti]|nr:hypothetical protein [Sinorhizobium meliloti]
MTLPIDGAQMMQGRCFNRIFRGVLPASSYCLRAISSGSLPRNPINVAHGARQPDRAGCRRVAAQHACARCCRSCRNVPCGPSSRSSPYDVLSGLGVQSVR